MSLINCKLCGHQVSENATACPSCGHPIKKIVKTSSCGVILICLAVGIAVSALMFAIPNTTGPTANTEKKSSTVFLTATVSKIGSLIEITNKDTFDWTNIKLALNTKPSEPFTSGYTLKVAVIKAGETYTPEASEFAKSDGEKFNPSSYKLMNTSIMCDIPQGSGWHYGEWK